ncbi:hypothetical protein SFRURICE_020584 [Spodoptera frugiperda]|nr:hypothetical protein SFRURICE_020584 [Spodoptera frugiperda]
MVLTRSRNASPSAAGASVKAEAQLQFLRRTCHVRAAMTPRLQKRLWWFRSQLLALPQLRAEIEGAVGTFLVDTGAKHCIGSVSLRSYLASKDHVFHKVFTELKYADGRICKLNVEVTNVKVTVRGVTLLVSFIMLPNATESLLGMNFIRDVGMVLDFDRGVWAVRGDRSPQRITFEKTPIQSVTCSSEVRKGAADRRRRDVTPFRDGDLVLVEAHSASNAAKGFSQKFAPRREGPYRVSQVVSPTTYVVVDNEGRVKGKYHASALTPYSGETPTVVHPRRRGRPAKSQPGRSCDLEGEPIARIETNRVRALHSSLKFSTLGTGPRPRRHRP